MVKIKIGNILDCTEDIIVHQVNIQGVMGGGLAKQLADRYPGLEQEYAEFCKRHHNIYGLVLGEALGIKVKDKFIVNIFSQKENFDTDYKAMEMALSALKNSAIAENLTIAIPYGIGCGIANGNWEKVYEIIQRVFNDYDVTLYRLEDK